MKRALESVSIVALASMFVMLAIVYPSLPDQIPNHFNTGPHPIRTIGKGSLWILPFLSANLFLFLTAAARLGPTRPDTDPMPLIIAKAAVMLGAASFYFASLP
jgi:hypothetical protein